MSWMHTVGGLNKPKDPPTLREQTLQQIVALLHKPDISLEALQDVRDTLRGELDLKLKLALLLEGGKAEEFHTVRYGDKEVKYKEENSVEYKEENSNGEIRHEKHGPGYICFPSKILAAEGLTPKMIEQRLQHIPSSGFDGLQTTRHFATDGNNIGKNGEPVPTFFLVELEEFVTHQREEARRILEERRKAKEQEPSHHLNGVTHLGNGAALLNGHAKHPIHETQR